MDGVHLHHYYCYYDYYSYQLSVSIFPVYRIFSYCPFYCTHILLCVPFILHAKKLDSYTAEEFHRSRQNTQNTTNKDGDLVVTMTFSTEMQDVHRNEKHLPTVQTQQPNSHKKNTTFWFIRIVGRSPLPVFSFIPFELL